MYFVAQPPNLVEWQTFYEIVGSSGGALVGLQFVVIALIANTRARGDFEAINAFGTPNVVHFGAALSISAVMTAPWPSAMKLSAAVATCGVLGLVYSANIFYRARRQTAYKPVAEDWIWYAILPCAIYLALAVAAVLLCGSHPSGLFVVAGAALGLLLVGVRNSWDTVTHVVLVRSVDAQKLD